MQRKRGELVPVAEAFSDLSGPVAAIRDASPQAQRGFTLADQVNQLVSASEADPERGFMARTMALCSLPRTNPGDRLQYKRQNGPCRLILSRTGEFVVVNPARGPGSLAEAKLRPILRPPLNPEGRLLIARDFFSLSREPPRRFVPERMSSV